jgi:hypothetical protein
MKPDPRNDDVLKKESEKNAFHLPALLGSNPDLDSIWWLCPGVGAQIWLLLVQHCAPSIQ